MYCNRNNIAPGKNRDSCCQQCGKELEANTVRVRRKGTEWSADVFLYWIIVIDQVQFYTPLDFCNQALPWSFHSWTSVDACWWSTWNHQVSSPSSLFRRRLRSLPFQESFTYRCGKRAIHHELIIPKVMLLIPKLPNVVEHCVTLFKNCITLFINPIMLFEYCKTIF